MEKVILKQRNFIFDNGLVNLFLLLESKNYKEIEKKQNFLEFKKELKIYPEDDRLIIEARDSKILDEFFNFALKKLIEEAEIVYFTENKRLFWDEELEKFVEGNKIDIKGGTGNDIKYTYIFKNLSDLKYKKQEFSLDLIKKIVKEKNQDFSKLDVFYDKNKNKVRIHSTLEDYIEKYIVYLTKNIILDSKIHPFEMGDKRFKDLLLNPSEKVPKWEALIYWYGNKLFKYYDYDFNLLLHSNSLINLFKIKRTLQISNKNITEINQEGEQRNYNRNINYKDILKGKYNFNTSNIWDWNLKILLVIYFTLYEVEKDDNKILEYMNSIYLATYSSDGSFTNKFNTYTKAEKLFKFFNKLKKTKYTYKNKEEENLLLELVKIMRVIYSNVNHNKEPRINFENFAYNLMNFNFLIKNYMTSQEVSSKKEEKKSLPQSLEDFEDLYLKLIKVNDEYLIYHNLSKVVGKEIGRFLASIDDKTLIFKLRAVRNKDQLINFISQFKFSEIKNESKIIFKKEFNENFEKLIPLINDKNHEVIRDYLSIYAIMNYKRIRYGIENKK